MAMRRLRARAIRLIVLLNPRRHERELADEIERRDGARHRAERTFLARPDFIPIRPIRFPRCPRTVL